MYRKQAILTIRLLRLDLMPPSSHARDVPVRVAGAGAAVIEYPDYRGSDDSRTCVLLLP
jgi:hypothetical protein